MPFSPLAPFSPLEISQVFPLRAQELFHRCERARAPCSRGGDDDLIFGVQAPDPLPFRSRIPAMLPASPLAARSSFRRPRSGALAAVQPTAALPPDRRSAARLPRAFATRAAPTCHRKLTRWIAVLQPARHAEECPGRLCPSLCPRRWSRIPEHPTASHTSHESAEQFMSFSKDFRRRTGFPSLMSRVRSPSPAPTFSIPCGNPDPFATARNASLCPKLCPSRI